MSVTGIAVNCADVDRSVAFYEDHLGATLVERSRQGAVLEIDGGRIELVALQELMAQEFPDFAPYPWGRFDWTRTLLLNIIMAQPLACQYAELFRGLDDSELDALADSFAFGKCSVRAPLLARLQAS